ncbi:MAG: aspartate aminotransferase family protein [Alphaproteobacteria bacterium]|nr:aspartate aminotransferase family protein [Alphaproteobacteria bacterium]
MTAQALPNDLEPFWMPFTANRHFKKAPRLLAEAKDMHYSTPEGRKILDATAGLWCVNAGHGREKIVKAVQAQVAKLDFAPSFNVGHPIAFELAARLTSMVPGYSQVFYTNSGSESVDTALKIALAYQRAIGQGTRTRLIGRERGYHGVGFGGMSVGGMVANRKIWGPSMLNGVDHIRHTHDPEKNAFSKGQPEWGAHLADDLERLVALHDASTIAAVIVEPVAGSTGVLVPPKGYLQRLRQICDKHGILLIFDEVITGFGRLGASFATEYFGVKPDLFTTAKGISNATIPMGAVFCRKGIYDAFMNGPEGMIEVFHGYTYSAHPVACAAALATLDIYREEGLFERAAELSPYWQEAVHSMKGLPNVIDIRNLGLTAGIELSPRPNAPPTSRGMDAHLKAFEKGVMVRFSGETICMSPPLIISKGQIDQIVDTVTDVIKTIH